MFVGKVRIDLNTVDSTNNYAKRLLAKSKPFEGTAIFAHYQEKGRGQYGKTWESRKDENLIFSLILYPGFLKPDRMFLLNQAISLAIRDVIATLATANVCIKWPNDIYCGNRKIAGILIENLISGNDLKHSVVGIGVNVNQTRFSPELSNPASLKLISGKMVNIKKLFGKICIQIEQRYLQLKSARDNIREEYIKHLYQKDELKEYQTVREKFSGKIKGVSTSGELLIEVNDKIRQFNTNEILYL